MGQEASELNDPKILSEKDFRARFNLGARKKLAMDDWESRSDKLQVGHAEIKTEIGEDEEIDLG